MDAAMFRCVKGTSLGAPVVPPVNIKRATSSDLIEIFGSALTPGAGVRPWLPTIRTSEEPPEVQRAMVTHQTLKYVTQQIPCSKCGKIQSRKGKHQIVLRVLVQTVEGRGILR